MTSVQAKATSLFKNSSVELQKDLVEIILDFNEPVEAENVEIEYIKRTIQFNIPNASINNESRSQKIDKDHISSLYTFKDKDNLLKSRLIFKKGVRADRFKSSVRIIADGSRLIFKVKNPNISWAAVTPLPKIKPLDLNAELEKELRKNKVEEKPKKAKIKLEATEIVAKEMAAKKIINIKEKEKNTKNVPAKNKINADDLKESEIPVFAKTDNKKVKKGGTVYKAILSVIFVIVLGVGSVLFAKWWGKNHKQSLGNNQIRVLTQHHLGPRKSLAIVRVAGESILLGVTDQNISMIKTLSLIDDEIPINVPSNFVQTLNEKENDSSVSVKVTSMPKDMVEDSVRIENPEDFTYGNLKKVISGKIKNMRQI